MEESTDFAGASRSSVGEVLKEYNFIDSQTIFIEIFEAISGIWAVLNKNRQIIYASRDFVSALGIEDPGDLLGRRPGEAISCLHSGENPHGCGTTGKCKYCGVVNAILESQDKDRKCVREATISSMTNGSLKSWDFEVTSSPVTLSGHTFYMLSLQDISAAKRLSSLERIFFHDLLNTVSGLNGLLTVLKAGTDPVETADLLDKSEAISRSISEEINSFRQLRAAESGDLQIEIQTIKSVDFLISTIERIKYSEIVRNRRIVIDENSDNVELQTDKILLQRVMVNLLTNALESSPEEDNVYTGVSADNNKVSFRVKNSGAMPEDVRMQVFKRSFSTKESGRGIGTYSIRLLTENYLKGKVSFVSNETDGTIFTVTLNRAFYI
jgi:nitrogen-specific signal transduction histidine kinase